MATYEYIYIQNTADTKRQKQNTQCKS